MTREEHAKFLAQCKEFVLGMSRLEQRIGKIDEVLTKDEQRTAFKEVFDWLGTTTEIPPNSYTREWARELLAAGGGPAPDTKKEGAPRTDIRRSAPHPNASPPPPRAPRPAGRNLFSGPRVLAARGG